MNRRFNSGRWEWTGKRVARLTALWEGRQHSAEEVATDLGTTRNAVMGKVNRLGLKGGRGRRDLWPAEEVASLTKLVALGLAVPQLADRFGRTEQAIRDMCGRLHLKPARQGVQVTTAGKAVAA